MIPQKSFIGAALGTLIEYYDYALFSTFLPIFAPLFFPANTAYESLHKGYLIILVTLFFRPLGGLFFGHFGDRFGRRKTLLYSIYGIAIATITLGIVPSYAIWGVWSAIIILTAKAVQIFCFGGEFNGAGIYVMEHSQNKNEVLISSLLTATTLFGYLLASLFGVILTLSFMPDYSWRIAFIFGGVLAFCGIFYRKNFKESPNFKASSKDDGLIKLIRKFPKEILAGMFVGGFSTVPFTTCAAVLLPILSTKGFISQHEMMLMQTVVAIVAVVALIAVGVLCNGRSPPKIMRISCGLLLVFSYPALFCIDTYPLLLLPALSILIFINELFLGPAHAFLKNLFPMQYRYRGTSFSFCLGMAIFGGVTPIIEDHLFQMTQHFSAISIWLILVGIGTYFSISKIRNVSVVTTVAPA